MSIDKPNRPWYNKRVGWLSNGDHASITQYCPTIALLIQTVTWISDAFFVGETMSYKQHFYNEKVITCKDTGEVCKGYYEYLNSEHWKKLRQEKLETYPKCLKCGKTTGLQVHHMTYDRLGDEKLDDLKVLCGFCHKNFHRLKSDMIARKKKEKENECEYFMGIVPYWKREDPPKKKRRRKSKPKKNRKKQTKSNVGQKSKGKKK